MDKLDNERRRNDKIGLLILNEGSFDVDVVMVRARELIATVRGITQKMLNSSIKVKTM